MTRRGGFVGGQDNLSVPDAPTIGTATAASTQVSVAFTGPSDVGDDPITEYAARVTDGTNTLKFGSLGKLTIAETRLYQPSLNKINNKVFDAEIVIQCITKNSNNFFICIPIEANDNCGTSNDWFSFSMMLTPIII